MEIPPRPEPFTADGFIWALGHPRGRWELVRCVVAMAPGADRPCPGKLAAVNAVAAAIWTGGLPCAAIVDGVAVRIDENTVYEPDALVRCGDPLPSDAGRARSGDRRRGGSPTISGCRAYGTTSSSIRRPAFITITGGKRTTPSQPASSARHPPPRSAGLTVAVGEILAGL